MKHPSSAQDEPVVIFTHIPKTAGTSLRHIVQSQFQPYNVFEFYHLKTQPPKVRKGIEKYQRLAPVRQKAISFVSGHVGFGLHQFLHRPCTYITVLRDPIERVVSYYYFLHRNQNAIAKDRTLREFIQNFGGVHNSMTCYLSGLTLKAQLQDPSVDVKSLQFDNDTLKQAQKNIEKHFKVVGFLDRFDETCILLQRKLGWNFSSYVRKNVAKRRNLIDEVSAEDLELIRDYNQLDLQLYDYAREKFAEAIAGEGTSFAPDLSRFQLNNQSSINRFQFQIQTSYKRLAYRIYEQIG